MIFGHPDYVRNLEETIEFYGPIVDVCIDAQIPDKSCVIFNTQSLTIDRNVNRSLKALQDPKVVEFWDFSVHNLGILRETIFRFFERPETLLAKLRWIPVQVGPRARALQAGLCTMPKTTDVGIPVLGSGTLRQSLFVDECIKHGITSVMSSDPTVIAQCRLVVHIHSEAMEVLNMPILAPQIEMGYFVISEPSLDADSRIVTVAYTELVPIILRILLCMSQKYMHAL